MAIRAPFRLLVAGFVGILTPIAIAPAYAESQSPSSDFLEVSVPSPQPDEFARPVPALDTKTEQPSLQDDASVWVPEDFDPWAYAFAESSRLQARSIRLVKVPEYSVTMNSPVKYFVDRFTTTRRDIVGVWIRRSGQYLGMIYHVFRAKGLPEDLAFTAMIESGFNPVAVSRVGAKGLWQFMAPTARLYGLRVDRWVDERLDPEKSTVAAARYLNDLYARYGSWELAQAAYNAGEVKVDKAIRGTGSTDFWDLRQSKYLRRETQDFVPAIQAAMVIGRDPSQFGFDPSPFMAPEIERVTVPASTDLRKLAASSGISAQTLRSLNPVLIRGISPPGRTWEVRVPSWDTGGRDGGPRAQDEGRRSRCPAGPPPAERGDSCRSGARHRELDRQALRGVDRRRRPLEQSRERRRDSPGGPASRHESSPDRRARRPGRVQVRVEVRLFATLAEFLPSDGRDGAAVLEIPEGSTVTEVTRRLGIPPDLARVVLVNGRDAGSEAPLAARDVVTIFPPLAGGVG